MITACISMSGMGKVSSLCLFILFSDSRTKDPGPKQRERGEVTMGRRYVKFTLMSERLGKYMEEKIIEIY